MKRLLSLLLAICMIASFFVGVTPQMALAAGPGVEITDAAELQHLLDTSEETVFIWSDTLLVNQTITIPEGRHITLRAKDANRAFVRPGSPNWKVGTPLFKIANGADVTFENVTINGAYLNVKDAPKLAQGIQVEGRAESVVLDSIVIQNCNSGGGSGAGLCIDGAPDGPRGKVDIKGHSVFWDNITNVEIPNGGGAIYVGRNYEVTMDNVEFMGNKAHSGGAMYVFNSYVFANDCDFGIHSARDYQNEAGQRGGAIHSHGTVILKDCTLQENMSRQNGGAIYVSANDSVQGMVLLDNTKVMYNSAMSSGGGIYVATDATLYVRGTSSVVDNYILTGKDDHKDDEFVWDNNVFYNTMYSKIVLLDDQTAEMGISTANPTDRKLAVYTIGDTGEYSELEKRVGLGSYSLDGVDAGFNHISDSQQSKITYDSESGIWKIVGHGDDPEAVASEPNKYHDGRLWLKLNITDPVGDQPCVIFDYNLPETYATVYPSADTIPEIKVGDPVPAPPRIDTDIGGAHFRFLRWSDQPVNGTPYNPGDNVTVKDGLQIYYTVEIRELYDNNSDHPIRVDDEAASKEDGPVTADSFTLSGEVLDEDGQPLEGVTVYLYGEDGQLVQTIFVETDAEETTSYEKAPVEDETESIAKIMASGVVKAVEEAVVTKMEETLAEVVPAEADTEEAEDASEETPGELDEADADLLADDGFIRLDEMETAADGKYVFAGLPAGRYVVKIARGIGGNGGSTDIPVTVQPLPEIPDDTDLTVTTDSYTVSGVVEDRGGALVNGAKVTLLDEQGKEIARMTTGADGAYVFETLSKGDYTVNISYPDSELLASGDVTISDDGFTTFPGQAVSGTVKDNKGNALANVTVTIRSEDGKTYTATTDKDGSYRVVVPDGKYTVEVNINGKTASKAITVSGKPATADLTVTLSSEGGSGSGSGGSGSGSGGSGGGSGSGGSGGIGGGSGSGGSDSVTEQPKVVLSGVVLDKDGNGVVGATITAVDTKTGETYTATTGLDGKYALAVPKGNYIITITYGSTTTNPKKVTVSKDAKLDDMTMDNLGKLVYGYVNGYADGTFGGGRSITRSEVAALISRVSAGFDKDKTYAFNFKDVPDGVWYANNLGYCVEAGLIQGRGNGLFDPSANITRAEFAAIVARFLGLPNEVTGANRYTDTSGNWAEGYIAQLTAKGIVEGKGDGKFDPNANISRYEAVTMLNRALDRTPDKAVLDGLMANLVIRAFPDLKADHWAYYQVLEAAFDHYHR